MCTVSLNYNYVNIDSFWYYIRMIGLRTPYESYASVTPVKLQANIKYCTSFRYRYRYIDVLSCTK